MTSDTQLAVDVGVLKKEMEAVTATLADMKQVNKEQSAKLDTIMAQLSEAKGGWRTMMWIGGSFASAAALVAAWAALFTGKH